MFLDPFFKRIMDLAVKMLDCVWHLLYPKYWLGQEEQVRWPSLIDLVESGSRPRFGGNSESEEGKLKLLLCIPIWQNWWFKQGEQVGWPPIHFIESDSRPKFQGDSESDEGKLKFPLCIPIWQNWWFKQEEQVVCVWKVEPSSKIWTKRLSMFSRLRTCVYHSTLLRNCMGMQKCCHLGPAPSVT
jgi:hypothetical protein